MSMGNVSFGKKFEEVKFHFSMVADMKVDCTLKFCENLFFQISFGYFLLDFGRIN